MNFETVIGLEVHVQLKTQTKLFCSCAVAFGGAPNSRICPVCTGQPGVLPRLNREALHLAIKGGLALHCRIPASTHFDRKNYFYPDLPKGYQVSQFDHPVAESGYLEIAGSGEEAKRIAIVRAHLEEDAGKVLHPKDRPVSLVDLNRAGVPLLEIVTAPVIPSPAEAHLFLTELKKLLQYTGISDCDMEKGSLRCDANLSLRPAGDRALGTKTEIKNLNSFRFVEKALCFEEKRQQQVLEANGRVIQETRLWCEEKEVTEVMRTKEEAHDYRYFPEPDLPAFRIDPALQASLAESLPETPLARKARFLSQYRLTEEDASFLTGERNLADYFETCAEACEQPGEAAKWIRSTVMKELNERNLQIRSLGVTAGDLGALLRMVEAARLSHQAARKVFAALIEKGGKPEEMAKQMGLEQVSDDGAIASLVDEVIARCPDMVREFREGKEATLNALVGMVMKASRGKANPQRARDQLKKKIRE